MELLLQVVFAFLAAAGFAVLFQAPKSCIVASGLTGASGWLIYSVLGLIAVPFVLAIFIASIVVAALSELMARHKKVPVTVFAVSGIVPLVPGSLAYSTMYSLAEGDYLLGATLGTKTFLAAGAIAAGIIFVGSLARMIKIRGDKDVTGTVINS